MFISQEGKKCTKHLCVLRNPKRTLEGRNKANRAAVFGVSSLCLRLSDSLSASWATDDEFKVVSANEHTSLFVATCFHRTTT